MSTNLPVWWLPADTAHCLGFVSWQETGTPTLDQLCAGDALVPRGFGCRRCWYWQSLDGVSGACMMPDSESTVNCGRTAAADLCEQWVPRVEQ